MRPLDRVDPLQRWLGSCPLLIFYGHHGPSFMAITSGFIGNLAAVTFGLCTAASLIQCKCMYNMYNVQVYVHVDFLEVRHQRGTKIRWIYSSTLCNFISHLASASFLSLLILHIVNFYTQSISTQELSRNHRTWIL